MIGGKEADIEKVMEVTVLWRDALLQMTLHTCNIYIVLDFDVQNRDFSFCKLNTKKSLRRNLNINYEKMSLKLKDMYFYMEGILSTINDKRLVYQGISLCDKVHDLS